MFLYVFGFVRIETIGLPDALLLLGHSLYTFSSVELSSLNCVLSPRIVVSIVDASPPSSLFKR